MDADAPALHPKLVDVADLVLDSKNARRHGDRNKATIGASLTKFRQRKPVVVNRRTMTVEAGNATLEAAIACGASKIVAVFVDDDDETAAAYAIADNQTAALAEWDIDQLADTISEFGDVDWDAIGFGAVELAGLGIAWPGDAVTVGEHERDAAGQGADPVPGPVPDDPADDVIPDPPPEPITVPGEVIEIGPHVVHCADCIEVMRAMPDNSVDAIVTDPPYGLSPDGRARTWDEIEALRAEGKGPKSGFMGRAWDAGVPGLAWARECLRVLKPGGHLVAFSASRTIHRLTCAIEDAGFEIREGTFGWLQWQGFPKSHNVSMAIDEVLGIDRSVVGSQTKARSSSGASALPTVGGETVYITAPASEKAQSFDGFGTALKPALEPAVIARKPIDSFTPEQVADILGQDHAWTSTAFDTPANRAAAAEVWGLDVPGGSVEWSGRPLRRDVTGRLELRVDGEVIASKDGPKYSKTKMSTVALNVLRWGTGGYNIDACRYAFGDKAWPGPDDELTDQTYSQPREPMPAGARANQARREVFVSAPSGRWPANLYACPKPATAEREAGLPEAGLPEAGCGTGALRDNGRGKTARNTHPTVKPVRLMRWLATLVTPPGGTLYEPFGGSGTTLVAGAKAGLRVIVAEREPQYCDIIRARGEHAVRGTGG